MVLDSNLYYEHIQFSSLMSLFFENLSSIYCENVFGKYVLRSAKSDLSKNSIQRI